MSGEAKRCQHGWFLQARDHPYGPGWQQDYAPKCTLGCAEGVGIPYKLGPEQKQEKKAPEAPESEKVMAEDGTKANPDPLGDRFLELASRLQAPEAPRPIEWLPPLDNRSPATTRSLRHRVANLEQRLETPCPACQGRGGDPLLASPVKWCEVCANTGVRSGTGGDARFSPGSKWLDRGTRVEVVGWRSPEDGTLWVMGEDGYRYQVKTSNLDPIPDEEAEGEQGGEA